MPCAECRRPFLPSTPGLDVYEHHVQSPKGEPGEANEDAVCRFSCPQIKLEKENNLTVTLVDA
eukprot:5547675-Pyramimonas_sp.AAC.1